MLYIYKIYRHLAGLILTLLVMIRGGFDGKVCFSKTKICEKRVSALFFEHVPIWKEAQISQLYHTCQDKINLAMVIAKIVFLYMVSFCINDSRARKRLFLQLLSTASTQFHAGWAITVDSSPLRILSGRTRTGNRLRTHT